MLAVILLTPVSADVAYGSETLVERAFRVVRDAGCRVVAAVGVRGLDSRVVDAVRRISDVPVRLTVDPKSPTLAAVRAAVSDFAAEAVVMRTGLCAVGRDDIVRFVRGSDGLDCAMASWRSRAEWFQTHGECPVPLFRFRPDSDFRRVTLVPCLSRLRALDYDDPDDRAIITGEALSVAG